VFVPARSRERRPCAQAHLLGVLLDRIFEERAPIPQRAREVGANDRLEFVLRQRERGNAGGDGDQREHPDGGQTDAARFAVDALLLRDRRATQYGTTHAEAEQRDAEGRLR